MRRAGLVVVLSDRDAKVVRRLYAVPASRVVNITPRLVPDLAPLSAHFAGPIKRACFLGSMDRKENRDAVNWIAERVLPACPELEVAVIGQAGRSSCRPHHGRLRFLGHVPDLEAELRRHEVMLAPMFVPAGIKVKVLDALIHRLPVLGTRVAYVGIQRPAGGWCSDDAETWVRVLAEPPEFRCDGLRQAEGQRLGLS